MQALNTRSPRKPSGRPKLSEETVEQMKNMLTGGSTVNQVTKALRISAGSVYRYAPQLGIKLRNRRAAYVPQGHVELTPTHKPVSAEVRMTLETMIGGSRVTINATSDKGSALLEFFSRLEGLSRQ